MSLTHFFDAPDEAADAGEALPQRLDAGLPVTFSGEESAKHGDAADDFTHGGRFLGWGLLGQQPRGLPFNGVKHFAGGQFGMDAPQSYQVGQSPGDDQINDQSQFEFFGMPQLQRLDTAAVLEHMEQGFDFPPAAIPVDQLCGLLQRGDGSIGQQTPLDRLLSLLRPRRSKSR